MLHPPVLLLEELVQLVGPVAHAADVEGEVVPHLGRRADGEGVPLGGAQPGEDIIILLVDRGRYRSAVADRGERMPVIGAQQDYISDHPLISAV